MTSVVRVNRTGKCPYCDSPDIQVIIELRPDRIAVKCNNCTDYSIRHVNTFLYPLEDKLDYTSTPFISVQYAE